MTSNPDGPLSPEQMIQWAETCAAHLLALPEEDRISWIESCRAQNPILWSLVRSNLSQAKEEAKKPSGKSASWIQAILGDLGILPKPEDNLGWGI